MEDICKMSKFSRMMSVLTVLILLCSAAAVPAAAEYEIMVPEEYKETGTMPVYRAVKNDFMAVLQPEWLNQSGIAEVRGEGAVTFNDLADLVWYPESFSYEKKTDELYEYMSVERQENPDREPEFFHRTALTAAITRLAHRIRGRGDRYEYTKGITLEHEQLTLISLAEARQKAEAFIERVGLGNQGYELNYALDMSLERIRTVGEAYDRYNGNDDPATSDKHDYSAATAEDEGYFLLYTLLGAPRIGGEGIHLFELYVTGRGIEDAHFSAEYKREGIAEMPACLISPEEAVNRFYEEIGIAKNAAPVDSVDQVALTYMPVRAKNKKDGMLFTPVWQIAFTSRGKSPFWAFFNAVDGTLIDAIFK